MNIITNPIITSILDNDAYKFCMQQAVFHRYNNINVSVIFHCRGKDLLGEYIGIINDQINMMSDLKLTNSELMYLQGLSLFCNDYLEWLNQFKFNPSQIKIYNHYGKLNISINGPWYEVILWEIPLLAIISEITHYFRSPQVSLIQAINQLKQKITYFNRISKNLDVSNFRLIDFGTRRRFSRKIQFSIINELQKIFPYFIGTSNYQIAKEQSLLQVGTQSHEWFQAHQQICPDLVKSQKVALSVWLKEYPNQLNIALTDCITMDAFLRDFRLDFARAYQGLRHDSGNPITWGEKAIMHYQSLGIDPMMKTLVFSDNLNFDKALAIYRHFYNRTNLIFGIGTNLTCDIPNIKPLNIVIKMIECNGKPVAKLSDSPGKAVYQDKAFVNKLRKAFDVPLIIKKAS